MVNIINFKNVYKQYSKQKVLDSIGLYVVENDFVALVGNNGCGKTTTINIMCNLISFNAGSVEMFGKELTPKYVSYKNRCGIVLSEPYYIEEFTAYEYLKFVCRFQKVPKKEVNQRIEDILNLLRVEDFKKKKIKELSSGNQMKITLCSALIHNPELLILDEPFVNLDINTTEKIIQLLKSFKGSKTLFISSHNLDLVAELCDRFLIMDKGKIVLDLKKDNYSSIDEMKLEIKSKLVVKESLNKKIKWLQ